MSSKQAELINKLSDRWWRLNNIYYIANEKGETITFKPNGIQSSIYQQSSGFRDIILKYRQGGVSTYKIIDLLDDCLFGGTNRNNVFVTYRKDLLDEFFKKLRFSYELLDPSIKALLPEPKRDNANELYFPVTKSGKPLENSVKISLTVRGRTPTNLHISEFAHMDAKEQAEIKLQIDSFRETSITIETTANGIGNTFYNMCMTAKQGKGTYKLLFFPWYIEPRNQVNPPKDFCLLEDEKIIKENFNLTDSQMYWRRLKIEDANACGKDIDYFNQENPITIESAFISSGSAVFNLNADFILKKHLEIYEDWKIFKYPQDDLVFGVDIAEGGNDGDFSTIVCYNKKGELILHYKGRVNENILAMKLDQILNYEKNGQKYLGWIVPENNTGRLFIKECQAYEWSYRLHGEIKTDVPIEESIKEPNKYGFRTSMQSKDYIIRLFKGAIHKKEVEISHDIKAEIDTYVYDKTNRPNAIKPNHDDLLMASMIAYFATQKIYGTLEYEEEKKKQGNSIEDLRDRDINSMILHSYENDLQNIENDYYDFEYIN